MERSRICAWHLAAFASESKGWLDCPGCAWPDPDGKRSSFDFCENGAKAVAHESDSRRVTRDFFQQFSVSELSLQSDYWLEQQGRLTEPMILRAGQTHYEPTSWDVAFALIERELSSFSIAKRGDFLHVGQSDE